MVSCGLVSPGQGARCPLLINLAFAGFDVKVSVCVAVPSSSFWASNCSTQIISFSSISAQEVSLVIFPPLDLGS